MKRVLLAIAAAAVAFVGHVPNAAKAEPYGSVCMAFGNATVPVGVVVDTDVQCRGSEWNLYLPKVYIAASAVSVFQADLVMIRNGQVVKTVRCQSSPTSTGCYRESAASIGGSGEIEFRCHLSGTALPPPGADRTAVSCGLAYEAGE